MNKKSKKVFSICTLFASVILVSGFKIVSESITQRQLNEQSVLALDWVQQSGEYKALVYQAFNIAQLAFDYAVTQDVTNPAVIVDIDETLLDNSTYQAGMLNTDDTYNTKNWNQWIKSKKSTPIPGAREFVNYVNTHGGKVFFISDINKNSNPEINDNDLEREIITHLQALGFQGVNTNTVLLKGEFTKVIDEEENKSKQFRREAVVKGFADGKPHQIVVLLGDNLYDFEQDIGKTNEQRGDYVQANQSRYGFTTSRLKNKYFQPVYVLLPNPLYGSWEAGLYNPEAFGKKTWLEMTPEEKSQQRKEVLRRWQPH